MALSAAGAADIDQLSRQCDPPAPGGARRPAAPRPVTSPPRRRTVVTSSFSAAATAHITRHRASISMYSLTFCVRGMLPERLQWKPAVQAVAVMLRTPPSTATHRPASHTHFPYTARNFENAPVTRRSPASSARKPRSAFALCRHIAGWTQACN